MKGSTMLKRESEEELRERLRNDEKVRSMIQARAYEIYQTRGGAPGGEFEDWVEAEAEVLSLLVAQESVRNAVHESLPSSAASQKSATSESKKETPAHPSGLASEITVGNPATGSEADAARSSIEREDIQTLKQPEPTLQAGAKSQPQPQTSRQEKASTPKEANKRKPANRGSSARSVAPKQTPKRSTATKQQGEPKKRKSPKKPAEPTLE